MSKAADGVDYAAVQPATCPKCGGTAELAGDGGIKCTNYRIKAWGFTELQGCGIFFGTKPPERQKKLPCA